jgi:CBS domain-containing protein
MSVSPIHEVGNIFPGEVSIVTIPPETMVGKALGMMIEKRFSQLPVVEDGEVIGVFSLWSLAHHLTMSRSLRVQKEFLNLEVGELLEQLPRVNVTDGIDSVLSLLEQKDALILNSPHGPQAVVTATDILSYFYKIARPYIMLLAIELALRDLINRCAPGDKLGGCIARALTRHYQGRDMVVPTSLEEMSFEDYRAIITCVSNWPMFEALFGRNRDFVSARLESIRNIRNRIFHFRSDISFLEHNDLVSARDWLLHKSKYGASKKEGNVR